MFVLQVLSESVSKAIEITGGPDTTETLKFILMFDRFFDLLNVSNFTNATCRRKPFQQPYINSEDVRLNVSYYTCTLCKSLSNVHFLFWWSL